jgi:Tfp pilus assembly protein FimV
VTRNDVRAGLLLALLAAAALVSAPPARAGSAGLCSPGDAQAAVSILVVASRQRVREFAASVRDARVVRRDADTVLFEDGRVVTSDVGALGPHLNALGWGHRKIAIVGSFASRRPRRPG